MRCPACATDNAKEATACGSCGKKLVRRRRRHDDPAVYCLAPSPLPDNPPAVAAYRCAVWGMIPIAGLILGPAALGFGVAGYRRAKTEGESRGIGHALTGIILGSLELISNVVGLFLIWIGIQSLAG